MVCLVNVSNALQRCRTAHKNSKTPSSILADAADRGLLENAGLLVEHFKVYHSCGGALGGCERHVKESTSEPLRVRIEQQLLCIQGKIEGCDLVVGTFGEELRGCRPGHSVMAH